MNREVAAASGAIDHCNQLVWKGTGGAVRMPGSTCGAGDVIAAKVVRADLAAGACVLNGPVEINGDHVAAISILGGELQGLAQSK